MRRTAWLCNVCSNEDEEILVCTERVKGSDKIVAEGLYSTAETMLGDYGLIFTCYRCGNLYEHRWKWVATFIKSLATT